MIISSNDISFLGRGKTLLHDVLFCSYVKWMQNEESSEYVICLMFHSVEIA